MTQALISEIPSAKGRVVLVLEGGYNLDSISQSFAACASKIIDHATAAATAAAQTPAPGNSKTSSAGQQKSSAKAGLSKGYQKTVNDVRRLHARYWKSLRGMRGADGLSGAGPKQVW
jgi:hypothetical protein